MENRLRILKKDKFVVPSKAGDGQIQGSGSDSLLRMGFAPASFAPQGPHLLGFGFRTSKMVLSLKYLLVTIAELQDRADSIHSPE